MVSGRERHHLRRCCCARNNCPRFSALRAVFALRLDVDLPLPAEAVEVVHEDAAHEALQRLVDVGEVDALLEHFVAVDLDEDLRHVGQEGRADAGRVPAACCAAAMNLFRLSARKATSCPARSSSTKVKPPAVPTPGMDGGANANATSLRDFAQLARSGAP